MSIAKVMLFSALVFGTTAAYGRNPVGEVANYKLDKNSARTSSMIKSGTMETKVTKAIPDAAEGPSYETAISYDFDIQFVGRQKGTELVAVEEEFFTEEFLQKLRTDGAYEGPDFKIKHEGYADARNLDGKFYPRCDKLLFYDIKTDKEDRSGSSSPVINLALALLSSTADAYGIDPRADIEDLKIRAHVAFGIPVLGAAKIDMSGKSSGMNVKAGADYVSP